MTTSARCIFFFSNNVTLRTPSVKANPREVGINADFAGEGIKSILLFCQTLLLLYDHFLIWTFTSFLAFASEAFFTSFAALSAAFFCAFCCLYLSSASVFN